MRKSNNNHIGDFTAMVNKKSQPIQGQLQR
uniref:Uncharacterized protein n=1 Tax=Siphoviridae sp. ct6bb17 TaxID=2825345 RepID=A0A8S5NZK5_9CAUD|nr:MAG TPA: hypothetical protein [Siphoviridae sp. ct6bb17]